MISVVSVCPQEVSHVTITHDALDLTVPAPVGPLHGTSLHWEPPASDN